MTELAPILLLGAGKMGAALFSGWAARGLPPSILIDPNLPQGVARPQDTMVASLDLIPPGSTPSTVILAIKPQMAAAVLPALGAILPEATLTISILAGLTVDSLSTLLGGRHAVVRAMPNTPAAIGQGMTVAVAGPGVTRAQLEQADALLAASGDLAWLHDESLIDPITSISGCGPAYVFLLAELLEETGTKLGIPPALARQLARRTVAGAGALLAASPEDSAQLRRNVTSPNGVTERALAVLMKAWPDAIQKALTAATERSRELAEAK